MTAAEHEAEAERLLAVRPACVPVQRPGHRDEFFLVDRPPSAADVAKAQAHATLALSLRTAEAGQ